MRRRTMPSHTKPFRGVKRGEMAGDTAHHADVHSLRPFVAGER